VILFNHSLATHLGMWNPQITPFSKDYRVLCYDTRGHGDTDAPRGPYTLASLARDAANLLDVLGIDKVHWVGISMGGMIGQAFALAYPDRLMSLALCDTTSEIPAEAHSVWNERIETARTQGMESLVEPTIDRWFSPGFVQRQPQTVETIRDMIRATPVEGFIGCSQAIMQLDFTGRLAEIRAPTLILVGEDDPGTPVAASELIHANMKGSELVVLPGARHLTNIEKTEDFNHALRDFLENP
jgi:3-oxoadipate enol-lactonase